MVSAALESKDIPDAGFLKMLKLIERAATDERNFVKKAVNWAPRCVGERSPEHNAAAIALAKKLGAAREAK